MANVNLQRTSWGYGELDQRMLGRTDLPTYRQGVVKMENWLPAKSGAAVMRGGMEQLKAVPTTFAADCIIPLRGGTSPLLGLYDSTNQKFRVLKADGSWVGTEAAPAEVQLFHEVTVVEQDSDGTEPYDFTLADPEKAAVDAFIDYLNTYATPPKASCFKIRLTKGSAVQDFSLEGGEITIDEVETDGTGSKITFEPKVPRPDSHIIDPAIAGNVLAYIDHVMLTRTTTENSPTAAKLHLNIHNSKDNGVLQPGGGAVRDIPNWEAGGKVSVLFNDEPGVLPLWAVEPNVAYDEVTVRLFRPNSDVKVYKITDTTITEPTPDEGSADLVGPVHNGKHASHGAYFEQRIVYGGGRNHRQEIVGSRSPNPLTGDRRYGQWALNDQTTTSVAGTSTQIMIPVGFQDSGTAWHGDGAATEENGGYMIVAPGSAASARQVDQAFTFGSSLRTLAGIQLGNKSHWAEGEAMFHLLTGSLDTHANEHDEGTNEETGQPQGDARPAATNSGGAGDRTGKSNWSHKWETTGRVGLRHGDQEIEIQMNNPNSGGVLLPAARSTIRITPAGGNPDLNEQQVADGGSATNQSHATAPGFSYYSSSLGRTSSYYNLVNGIHNPLHVGSSAYQLHDPAITTAQRSKDLNSGANGSGTAFDVAELSSDEASAIRNFLDYILDLDPEPDPASFTITLEMGTTSTVTTTTGNSDNAFQWVIDTGTTYAEVRWLQVYSGVLVAGTSAGIALCKFLNPDDPPEIRWHSSQSVARKAPLSTPLGILAVSADKTSVYEVIKKRELTAYSEDRFRKDKIHTIAWQQQPQQRLWVVTEAGKIHVLTIQDENAVNGWAQITHQHAGTCTGVVVTPGDDADDTVWFLMKYGAQSYVEKYHEAITDLHSNRVFMDSAVKRKVGYQTISMATSAMDSGDISGEAGCKHIQLAPLIGDLDNKLSAMFVGSADVRYIGSILLKDEDGSTGGVTRQAEVNFDNNAGGGSQDDMGADFEGAGIITVKHTAPITGTVLSVDLPFSATDDTADPYQWTEAQLGGVDQGGGSDLVEAFVDAIRALYPDGDNVAGSAHFEIDVKMDTPYIAIPDNMVNVSGKKLVVTSAAAAGDITATTKYEILDSPATSALETTFDYGEEVWVGFQVIADMELPPIDQSISGRIAGSWLGQPARIPWTVAGVEKSHSVKIGPTYDKLVEYCADTTTLSVTAAIPTANTNEPYVYTPTNSAEVDAWVNSVRALHANGTRVAGANLFTITLAIGSTTQSVVCSRMDIASTTVTLYPTRNATNLLTAPFLINGTGTRYVAALIVANTGNRITLQIAPTTTATGSDTGNNLITGFETGGSVAVTRTAPAPLVTGHERRPLPTNVSTGSPVVIRKDTPSPCTMTYMVVEAATG